MILPELEYISIEDAAKKFNLSQGELQGHAEELRLPVYVQTTEGRYRWAKLKAPRWEFASLVSDFKFCSAIFIDKFGNPVTSGNNVIYTPGCPNSRLYIKPAELRALDLTPAEIKSSVEQPLEKSPEERCNELKSEGLSDKEIAKKLKHEFPQIYPSRIGRLLPAKPGTYITKDAQRRRGVRLLE